MLIIARPNEQKMFYNLFLRYRSSQLENYVPDGIGPSTSDYHHVRPGLPRGYSTMEFASVKGHGRQTSRFTVFSNAAETEYSYDPFKASRPQHLGSMHSDRARITILRDPDTPEIPTRRTSKLSSQRSRVMVPMRSNMTRSSLASSTRSRGVIASTSYRRGVSFNHMRRMDSSNVSISGGNRHSSYTEVTDDGGDFLRPVAASTQYIRSRKQQLAQSQPLLTQGKPARSSLLWNDDVRQLSSSLASDCDKAFNRTSMVSEADTVRTSILSYKAESLDWNAIANATTHRSEAQAASVSTDRIDNRPLPRTPHGFRHSPKKRPEAQKLAPSAAGSSERRIMSAPAENRASRVESSLAPISETRENAPRLDRFEDVDTKVRNVSAPEPRYAKDTIRYVVPSSPMSPVKVPKPLVVRKISSTSSNHPPPTAQAYRSISRQNRELGLRQQYVADALNQSSNLPKIDEQEAVGIVEDNVLQRKSAWYSHSSKRSDVSEMSVETFPIRKKSTEADAKSKSLKSRLGQLFKKKRKEDIVQDEHSSTGESFAEINARITRNC